MSRHSPTARALCPLESALEGLMQIELTEDLERPMTTDGYPISLETEIATLRRALKNLVLAVEDVMREGDEWDSDDFDHYEAARAALGCPIETFPGGPEGAHFHWLEYDPEEADCGYCDLEAQAKQSTR